MTDEMVRLITAIKRHTHLRRLDIVSVLLLAFRRAITAAVFPGAPAAEA